MRKLIIILFLLSITAVGSLAQDDMLMNWCDVGGPMEGSCTIPGDEALTSYFWELGWYLAAVDRYEIALDDIPDRFKDNTSDDTGSSDDDKDASADCDSVKLPGAPDSVVTVTGELVYEGTTYASIPIPAGTYNSVAAGETYKPSIIGDTHGVNITMVDNKGNTVKKKSYKFDCTGDFDPTAGGIIPSP